MAALSAAIDTPQYLNVGVSEAKQVYSTTDVFYSGALVEIDPGTGLVSPLGSGNATSFFYGVCNKTKTTATSSTTTVSLRVDGFVVESITVTGVTGDADFGKVVYCSTDNIDDATLTPTSGTTRAIGTVYHHVSATTCHIRLFSAAEQVSKYGTGLVQMGVSTASSSEHENTTTEAMFDTTYTIPANSLRVGDVVKIRAFGTVVDSNSTDTLTVTARWGGAAGDAIAASAAVDVADNDVFFFDSYVTVRTIGATGTIVASTSYQDPDAAGTAPKWVEMNSTSVDTTADTIVGISADWSVAHADNEARLDQLVVEVLRRAHS